MTITVFDTRSLKVMTPKHEKPTFTEIARKIGIIRVRILRVRSNLRDIDTLLNDAHDLIVELEEVTQQ